MSPVMRPIHSELRAKRLAKLRDGGRCLICRRKEVWKNHVHHLLPKALYPNQAALTGNMVTLCVACHLGIVHGGNIKDGSDPEGNWNLWLTPLSLLHQKTQDLINKKDVPRGTIKQKGEV